MGDGAMQGFFQQLFDYNFFCNKKWIESCNAAPSVPEKSLNRFGHLLNAHHIWNARITGETPLYGVWQGQPMETWADIHDTNQRTSFDIISGARHFQGRIDYENSQGQRHTNTLGDILFHIINHSTHHRGQMASDFRAAGMAPPQLDYIFYKR